MTERRINWLTVYSVALVVFLFLPVVTIVVFSFDEVGIGTFPLTGFTTRWYTDLASNDVFIAAAKNSVYVALAAGTIAVALGTLAAFGLTHYQVRLSGGFTALVLLPIALPGLLLGVALLSFFDRIDWQLSLWTVILSHVLITLPFVVLTMTARLSSFDWSLEDAARDLGATPIQTFARVTFPIIRPSVIGSGLLVVALSLDEFIVTFFTIGAQNTLPVVIWGQMRTGVSPVVNAVSTLMLAATLILVVAARRFSDVRFR